MNRRSWTVIGAAGLMTGATIGGFSLVTATAADRAVRGIELQHLDPTVAGSANPWADGSVDSATGLPKPILTIPTPAADSVDSIASVDSSPEVIARPIVRETVKPTVNVRPAADSSASVASVTSAASADSADSSD